MQLVFDIPMLADHRDEGGGRPYHAGKIEVVVTRDRGLLVGYPNSFHRNHCLEAWPFLQCRQRLQVWHDPDAAAHTASVGVVECIKDIGRITPREMVRHLRMTVRCDGSIGFWLMRPWCAWRAW